MATPRIFISHRWVDSYHYLQLKSKFAEYGFVASDYSVPQHDPYDLHKVKEIQAQLDEQVRQCNFFIIIAKMSSANSVWCQRETAVALAYQKRGLAVRPHGYTGNIPRFIRDTQWPEVGWNTPNIISHVTGLFS